MQVPLEIVLGGTPILYQKATSVERPQSKKIEKYADDMVTVLKASGGLAIAAPQVGIPLRMFVIDIPKESPNNRYDFLEDKNHKAFPLTVMINPTYIPLSKKMNYGWESCLSFPGYRGKVERFESIRCEWISLDGEKKMLDLNGFNAKVFQHEYDHLDGIVYIQRIKDFSTFSCIPILF